MVGINSATLRFIYMGFFMRNQITVIFDKGVEFTLSGAGVPTLPHDIARAWLDAQFTALECEPLRASGKLLTVDKVLTVTQAAGPALFADPQWATDYASAVFAALAKPVIRVDVPAMAITY